QKALGRVLSTWELSSIFSSEKLEEIREFIRGAARAAAAEGSADHPPHLPPPPPSGPTLVGVPPPTGGLQRQPHPPQPQQQPLPPPPQQQQQQQQLPPSQPLPQQPPQPNLPPLPPPPPQPVATPLATVPSGAMAPDMTALVNGRMKLLLDQQQMHELGHAARMSVEDLWQTNAELAQEFRLVATAQINEELGRAGAPPPHPITPAAVIPAPATPSAPPTRPHGATTSRARPAGTAAAAAAAAAPGFSQAVELVTALPGKVIQASDASARGDEGAGKALAAAAAGVAARVTSLLQGLSGLGPWHRLSLEAPAPGAVGGLYGGSTLPFLCKQDGMRFRTQDGLDEHMDVLFRRKRARRDQKGLGSREWFCTKVQWVTDFGRLNDHPGGTGSGGSNDQGKGGGGGGDGAGGAGGEARDEDLDGAEACVPADERFTKCRICGDRFEMFYDNEEEEWMYRNACYIDVQGPRGRVQGQGEEGLGGDDGEVEGEGEGGEGVDGTGEGTRQIIVHRSCLDFSGLRDRGVITWRDLIPGTPTLQVRPPSPDDGEGEVEGEGGDGSLVAEGGRVKAEEAGTGDGIQGGLSGEGPHGPGDGGGVAPVGEG
ncbi:unnamed protein product, partial [Discosporangium mesarthrocarpum]